MQGVIHKEIPVSELLKHEMNFCLGCYACMSACPAGVKYDEILETGRRAIPLGRIKRGLLRFLFAKKSRLRLLTRLFMPWKKTAREMLPAVIPAIGPLRARVALFTGCVMDMMSAAIHVDSVKVLTYNGCEVHLLDSEECCGALLGHAGDEEGAEHLVQRNTEVFRKTSLDAIVVNAAGCGAYLKKHGEFFDIQEFLDRIGLVEPTTMISKKVAVQEPCHLVHAQKVSQQVTNLLKKIPGITLVPLEGAKDCCGSAGIYNITQNELSMEILDQKMEKIRKANIEVLVTGNPGCMFQFRYGAKKFGLNLEVVHPVELLARSLD